MATRKGKHSLVKVIFLDDTVQVFQVPAKAYGGTLYNEVVKKLQLLEADYFDLEFTDVSGCDCWLDREKPVLKQLNPVDYTLRFVVKFYTPDPGLLEDEYTRYLFSLQIRRDLFSGAIPCQDHTAVLLASYIVQAELGDFLEEEYTDHSYLKTLRLLPHQSDDLEIKIMEHHREHIGQSPSDAEFNLLDTARKVELYGIKMHPAKDHEGVSLNLAVAHLGVLVFQGFTRINTFSWAKIRKLSFKRKKFLTKLHPEGYGYYKDTVEFYFESRNECKNFWKKCIEHHAFFRCHSVKKPIRHKTRVVSKGSSFRYSGRTQKQLTEYVRDQFVKRSTFERSASQRTMVSIGKTPTPNTGTLNSKHEYLMHNTSSGSHTLESNDRNGRSERARSTERPNENKKSAIDQLDRTAKGASDDFNYEYYQISYDDKLRSSHVNGIGKIFDSANDNDDGLSRGSYHLSIEGSLDREDSSIDALSEILRDKKIAVKQLSVEELDENITELTGEKNNEQINEVNDNIMNIEPQTDNVGNKEDENNCDDSLDRIDSETVKSLLIESFINFDDDENIEDRGKDIVQISNLTNTNIEIITNENIVKENMNDNVIEENIDKSTMEENKDENKNEQNKGENNKEIINDLINGNTASTATDQVNLNEEIPYILHRRRVNKTPERQLSRESSDERPRLSRDEKRAQFEQIKSVLRSREQSPSMIIDCKSLPPINSFSSIDDTVSPTAQNNFLDMMKLRDLSPNKPRVIGIPPVPPLPPPPPPPPPMESLPLTKTTTPKTIDDQDIANFEPPRPLLPSFAIVEESSTEEHSQSDTQSSAPTIKDLIFDIDDDDEICDRSELFHCDTVTETVAKFLADERNFVPPYPPPPIPCSDTEETDDNETEKLSALEILSPDSSKINLLKDIDDNTDNDDQNILSSSSSSTSETKAECDVMDETVSSFLLNPKNLDLSLPPPPPPPPPIESSLIRNKPKSLIFATSSSDSSFSFDKERKELEGGAKECSTSSIDTSEKEIDSSTSSENFEKAALPTLTDDFLNREAPRASMEDLSATTDSEEGIVVKGFDGDLPPPPPPPLLFNESQLKDEIYLDDKEFLSSDDDETISAIQSNDQIEEKFENLLEFSFPSQQDDSSDDNECLNEDELIDAAEILDADVLSNPYNVVGDQDDFEMSPIKIRKSMINDGNGGGGDDDNDDDDDVLDKPKDERIRNLSNYDYNYSSSSGDDIDDKNISSKAAMLDDGNKAHVSNETDLLESLEKLKTSDNKKDDSSSTESDFVDIEQIVKDKRAANKSSSFVVLNWHAAAKSDSD